MHCRSADVSVVESADRYRCSRPVSNLLYAMHAYESATHAIIKSVLSLRAGAVKVTEWLLILIGPSVEECFKSGFKNWCRDVQIIDDCMRE